jgi:hypothetical protein
VPSAAIKANATAACMACLRAFGSRPTSARMSRIAPTMAGISAVKLAAPVATYPTTPMPISTNPTIRVVVSTAEPRRVYRSARIGGWLRSDAFLRIRDHTKVPRT